MKKSLLLCSLLLCLCWQNVLPQTEVRGIETRRVIYHGSNSYHYGVSYTGGLDCSDEYYGWEFYNANSIPVALDIELWCQDGPNIVKTQSIILKAGERYIFKREEHESTQVKHVPSYRGYGISSYYVKYKAFKLE